MSRVYLVTGAAGFLGSNVCAQLLEKGEKVRALVCAAYPIYVAVTKHERERIAPEILRLTDELLK